MSVRLSYNRKCRSNVVLSTGKDHHGRLALLRDPVRHRAARSSGEQGMYRSLDCQVWSSPSHVGTIPVAPRQHLGGHWTGDRSLVTPMTASPARLVEGRS